VALQLKRNGITRIRPLQGGLNLWMDRQFPIEELQGLSRAAKTAE
jgi:3-mercaptopyruvate sulfurtransferase SseA